jgi:RTX calcium-binding nonapeptide repeat (4 copies)
VRNGFHTRAGVLAILIAGVMIALTPTAAPASPPTCFGKRATQVGSDHSGKLLVKPHAVVATRGGNDRIIVRRGDQTKHFICAGPGDDTIMDRNANDILVGGPGDDAIYGKHGADVIIGDSANPNGDESEGTGNDYLVGGTNSDFIVGDNYASGNASGGNPDRRLVGNDGNDTLIGGSASIGGDATGTGADHLEGASGDDLVIGDSYAPAGTATGGGDDEVNGGPGIDLQVGDSYTETGMAIGGGNDKLHGADGGDAGARCRTGKCDDAFYGDDYAASCGKRFVSCGETSGGGRDLLTSDQGNDFLNGGSPDDPELRGNGDKCAGGGGRDTATRCEYVYGDVESVLGDP